MAEKDPKSPATTSMAYDEMLPVWQKVGTLLGGKRAMEAAGRAYLPQHAMEEDEVYQERLARAKLLNMTALTLNSWVGRPFSKPITFEDVPKPVDELLWDVDLAGTDVQVFCRNWFQDGMAKALSHVLVDFPRVDQDRERPRTLADDRDLRPYWVHVKPEQVIFADAETVNGREILREVRIKEEVVRRLGFAEVVVQQIRRFFRNEADTVTVEEYQYVKKEWVLQQSYEMTIDEIPLVTFYADRSGFMTGKSPLEDLADINIAHWQSDADQRHILTVTRFPILSATGVTDAERKLIVGPNRWLVSRNPQARFSYVEHSGSAIGAGRQDLIDLEEQMGQYGVDYLKKRPTTLGERILDNAEVTSPLQDSTVRFGHSLKQVLDLTAKWLSLPDGGVATMFTDFQPAEVTDAELTALREMRRQPADISRSAFLAEMVRRGILDEEYDAEGDLEQLQKEQMELMPPLPREEDDEEVEEEAAGGSGNDDDEEEEQP